MITYICSLNLPLVLYALEAAFIVRVVIYFHIPSFTPIIHADIAYFYDDYFFLFCSYFV